MPFLLFSVLLILFPVTNIVGLRNEYTYTSSSEELNVELGMNIDASREELPSSSDGGPSKPLFPTLYDVSFTGARETCNARFFLLITTKSLGLTSVSPIILPIISTLSSMLAETLPEDAMMDGSVSRILLINCRMLPLA